jgi:hypothetical protein
VAQSKGGEPGFSSGTVSVEYAPADAENVAVAIVKSNIER